jgi:hypothetical protein
VFGCTATPAVGCRAGAKVQIQLVEKTVGKEQIKIKIDNLADDTPIGVFGDPVNAGTDYAVCLYDSTSARIAALRMPRTQQTCGTKPCWKPSGTTGFKYTDKTLSSDGVLQLQLKGGTPTKGKVGFKAKNNSAKGQVLMPTGLTLQLTNDSQATAQVQLSNGTCFSGTVTTIRDNSAVLFKGTAP